MKHECECGKTFDKPVTSGHKRKCQEWLRNHPKPQIPNCTCGFSCGSMTQMKRHRSSCGSWKARDSKKISRERLESTSIAKYGVSNPILNPEVSKKKAETMIAKYGAENPFSKESSLYEKVQSHWEGKDRTAHLPKNNFAIPEVKEKIRDFWLKNYGVENGSQVPEIRARQLSTTKERFGDECSLRADSVKSKARKTNLTRYGDENVARSPEIQNKIKLTNLSRYGVPWTTLGVSREKQYITQIRKYGQLFFSSNEGKRKVRESLLKRDNTNLTFRRSCGPNNVEQVIHHILPCLQFTGNGSLWKNLPTGLKNPDFIFQGPDREMSYKGIKKVVEVLGVYWHGFKKTCMQPADLTNNLLNSYRSVGISCLFVWEDETWDNLDGLSEKLVAFSSYAPYPLEELSGTIPDDGFMVRESEIKDVFNILENSHPHGFGRSSLKSFVLEHNGKVFAVAKFSIPPRTKRNSPIHHVELDRLVFNKSLTNSAVSLFIDKSIELLRVHTYFDGVIFSSSVNSHEPDSSWDRMDTSDPSVFYVLPNGFKVQLRSISNRAKRGKTSVDMYAKKIGARICESSPPTLFIKRSV